MTQPIRRTAKLNKAKDVVLANPNAGHVLSYNSSTKTWHNQPLVALSNNTPYLTPEQFGAVGNGTTDDQTALQNWLNNLGPNVRGKVSVGKTYNHSNELKILNDGVHIDGLGAAFVGTDPAVCALTVNGNNASLENVTVRIPGSNARSSLGWQAGLFVAGCSGFTGRNIVSEGAPNIGILFFGASYYLLEDAFVANTWADGIHSTGGSFNGIIRRPVVRHPADDAIAVVSYQGEPITHDISIESPRVWGQNHNGRGVSVVGGTNITYTDIAIYDCDGSAVYIATEDSGGSYYTQPVTNARVLGGKIVRAVQGTTDHGAIQLFNEHQGGLPMTDVLISDLIIEDTRTSISSSIRTGTANGATLVNCAIASITLRGTGPDADYGGTVTPAPGVLSLDIHTVGRKPLERFLEADVTTSSTTNSTVPGLLFFPYSVGTYELEVHGAYQSTSTSAGPRFGTAGNFAPGLILASLKQATSATTVYTATMGWVSVQGANPSAAYTDFPFTLRATLVIDTIFPGSGPTIELIWASSAAGETQTIRAGTRATLRRIS